MSVLNVTAPPRRRLVALRVVAVGYALLTAIASFGLPSLVTAWFTSGDELGMRTAYVVWGVLAGLLIPGLVLSLLGRLRPAVWQAIAGLVVGTVVAMALAFEPENLGYAAVIVGPAVLVLLLHPRAGEGPEPARVDRVPLAIAVVMTVPVVWYGVDLAGASRGTSYLDTMHGQYAQGAVLVFSLLLMSFLGARRQPGRMVVVTLVSVSAACLGLAGLLFPQDPMSIGSGWGAVTLLAAGAYAAAAGSGSRSSRVVDAA